MFLLFNIWIYVYIIIYMTRIIYNYIMPQGLSKLILFEPNKVLEILPCVFFLVSSKATVGEKVLMIWNWIHFYSDKVTDTFMFWFASDFKVRQKARAGPLEGGVHIVPWQITQNVDLLLFSFPIYNKIFELNWKIMKTALAWKLAFTTCFLTIRCS